MRRHSFLLLDDPDLEAWDVGTPEGRSAGGAPPADPMMMAAWTGPETALAAPEGEVDWDPGEPETGEIPAVEAPGPADPQVDEPPPPVHASPIAAPKDDPASISAKRILDERPDVLQAYYEGRFGPNNDPHSTSWMKRVGGETPEAYAMYWYDRHGRYEGYAQGATTAGDNISLSKILQDRPDVLRAFYEEYYGPHNDRHSDAWMKRVGGTTPEDYARYWYDKFGRWEGYSQSEKAALENIDVERLLTERQDVFRAYYEEYYGAGNDRHSTAWVNRVGGDTVQDYAKYWYVTFGAREGYSQRPPADAWDPPPHESKPSPPDSLIVDGLPVVDPSLDPWNHQAIFPGARPPGAAAPDESPLVEAAPDAAGVGQSLGTGDLFG